MENKYLHSVGFFLYGCENSVVYPIVIADVFVVKRSMSVGCGIDACSSELCSLGHQKSPFIVYILF